MFSLLSSCLTSRNNQSSNSAGRARAADAAEAAEIAGGVGITNHGFQINNFYVFGENSDILRSVNAYSMDKLNIEVNGSRVHKQNQSKNEKLNACKLLSLNKSTPCSTVECNKEPVQTIVYHAKKNLKKCNSVWLIFYLKMLKVSMQKCEDIS